MKKLMFYLFPLVLLLQTLAAATIDLSNIRSKSVYIYGFQMPADGEVEISAIGSGYRNWDYDDRNIHTDPTGLYATAWIIDAESRKMIWRMTRNNTSFMSRSDNFVTFDGKVKLAKGHYELYFYGRKPNYFSSNSVWNFGDFIKRIIIDEKEKIKDNNEWKLVVEGVEDIEDKNAVVKEIEAVQESALFHIRADRGGLYRNKSFQVEKEVKVNIYAIGEGDNNNEMFDFGWITEIDSRKKIWQMRSSNDSYGGGAWKNRVYMDQVTLKPGSYKLVYKTDDSHHFGNWNSNIPFDPFYYGVTVTLVDEKDRKFITDYKPKDGKTIVEILRVGDHERIRESFKLEKASKVKIEAIGEGSDGEMYDYGYLLDDNGKRIWRMNYYETSHAGGASKNRMASEVLQLLPGKYKLVYKSDGSHSFPRWNAPAPEDQENWGIQVKFIEEVDAKKLAVKLAEKEENVLVDITQVSNDSYIKEEFELKEETRVRVICVGEGTSGKMYDYGWIESTRHKKVWEMDYDFTTPAGGNRKNRMIEETVILDPGKYRVFYVTDDSHAFEQWNATPPSDPEKWGIQILVEK
jgi:hypothetical protein